MLPCALCWSNSFAACPIAMPMNAFCGAPPCPADCPPVNIFIACIAEAA